MDPTDDAVAVAAAAVVVDGRVLAARRARPSDVRGGWELPGGKVDAGETIEQAVAREVREELGCEVAFVRSLTGTAAIKPGYRLTAHLVRLVSGEPVPHEHDALRWLSAEELEDVSWLPADRPFLDELRTVLDAGSAMAGGNVGGAVRVGRTVRRAVGRWTPAVHALLDHLAAAGLVETPKVIGLDASNREALTYMHGSVAAQEPGGESLPPEGLVADAMRWLREYHAAVVGFTHPGPWRNDDGAASDGQIICHHDFAPYNVAVSSSADGPRVVGVFDWDMCGPGTPLQDLAFAAWNWVPLWRALPPELAARRIRLMASEYAARLGRTADRDTDRASDLVGAGGDSSLPTAREILDAVVARIERSIGVIAAGQASGDPGMLNLASVGEPARTAASLDDLRARIPSITAAIEA